MAKKKTTLGDRLLRFRLANGLSLRDAAPQVGVSPPTILRCERGERVNVRSYVAIGKGIGEDEQELLKEYLRC